GEYFCATLNEGSGSNVTGRLSGSSVNLQGSTKFEWSGSSGPFGPAPVLTKDNSFLVGDVADFEAKEPVSLGAWVLVPKDFKGQGSVMARMGGEEEKYRGWELLLRDDEFAMQMIHRSSNNKMEVRSTGKALKRDEWQHLFVTYDGSGRTPGLKLF